MGILWRMAWLADHYGRMRLKLPEISEQIGLAEQTIRNRRTKGDFQWIKVDGRGLFCDASDLAAYLEQQSSISREVAPS